MIKIFQANSENVKDYNSEFLLKILNNSSIKNSNEKQLFVDENWKINSKNMNNIIPYENASLKKILLEIFPDKKILIKDNKDGSQTIFLS
ncbi:hypothetical protein [uncultured Prochlorococcus sp.]|uniref:hypothetical protein n=1 Tax=uncultured Prochlorococcus sp. TaxID=159733 RepID=UPI00258FE27F|nr:hypothetical protein [uncultured Prochlorococcus sp.]